MTLTQPRVILAPYVDLGVNSAVRGSATCECEESEDELPNQSSGQRDNGGAIPIRDARAGALSSSSSVDINARSVRNNTAANISNPPPSQKMICIAR